jgi:phage-related protein
MKHFYLWIASGALVVGSLLLAACSTGALPTTLTVIEDACEAANVTIPILEAAGTVTPAIANTILTYTSSVATAASQASQELLSTDSAAVQASKIIADFAAVAIPALGPTVGPEVQGIVSAIEAAVNLFVNQFKAPAAQKAIASGALDHQKLASGDRRKIGQLQKKFTSTASTAKSLVK